MNRILSIAILLLNLFVANNVQAQSYSSELGVGAYSGRYPFTNSGDIRSVRW